MDKKSNKKIYLIFVLHAYQPPTQDINVLKKIDNDCYKQVFNLLSNFEDIKINLNINSVLIELFYEYGIDDTLDIIKNLYYENKIQICGSAKYHPILPLIPEKEIYRQIKMDEELKKNAIDKAWKGKVFFPPELAINSSVSNIVKNLGYKSIILSGIACPAEEKGVDWPYNKIYCSPNGLQLSFRDDILSNKIAFNKITAEEFIENIGSLYATNSFFELCLDLETFGHHIKNYEKTFFGKTLELID
ncbi:MAG: hypothetical protein ACTSQG_04815, partial [Promethearchaeota archaeon]